MSQLILKLSSVLSFYCHGLRGLTVSLFCLLPAEICRKEMDLAIAIQSFPNMTRCSWTSILDFLKTLVSKFDVSVDNVNVGIVSYSVRMQLQNAFNSLGPKYLNVEEIQRVINNVFLSKDISSFDESLRFVDGNLFSVNLGSRDKSLKVWITKGLICTNFWNEKKKKQCIYASI